MTNEELIERGNRGEALLHTATFHEAMADLTRIYMSALLNTKSEQTNEREHLYAGARAVQDISGVLNQWVAVRDQIIDNANFEEPDSI